MMDTRNEQEGTEIDLGRLFQAIVKKLWIIVALAIIFSAVTFILSSMLITPKYRTYFTAYVNNRVNTEDAASVNTSELNASIGLTYLYEEIIISRSVLTDAAKACGINAGYTELTGMVRTVVSENAALIRVYVMDTDPVRATDLANAIAEAAPVHVARVVDGSSMRIVDAPVQPEAPYSPNNMKNALLGAVIGIVLSVLVVVILELTNDLVQDSEDLERAYSIAVVGNIPNIATAEKNKDAFAYRRTGEVRR